MITPFQVAEPTHWNAAVHFHNEVQERIRLLGLAKLFADVPEAVLSQFAHVARVKTVRRGETLFLQGEPVRGLFLLHTGCIKLSLTNLSGTQVIVGMCGPLDAVDLNLASGPRPRGVTAEAVSSCRLLSWNALAIEDLFRRTPVLNENVRTILARQLFDLQERFGELSSDKVERRVASAISRLAREFGRVTEDGIDLFFSREELAQMTGTTLFTVSRLLSRWKDLGLVVPRREAILIPDLKKFCGATSHTGTASLPRTERLTHVRKSPLRGETAQTGALPVRVV